MSLYLDGKDIDAIRQHGEEAFPYECCGYLFGSLQEAPRRIRVVERAENAKGQEEQRHRFLISSDSLLEAERRAREQGLDVMGFYHSHPNASARPSAYDREHAWPVYSYVIVSVKDGVAQETTSWVLESEKDEFMEEELVIETPM